MFFIEKNAMFFLFYRKYKALLTNKKIILSDFFRKRYRKRLQFSQTFAKINKLNIIFAFEKIDDTIMKHVTITRIAEELNISVSSVSRALRGDDFNVNKETKQRILETAERMGYRRSKIAMNLRENRTRTIGIVIPELVTTFYVDFITKVQSMLYEKGFQTSLAICNENPDIERNNLQMMLDNQVEGILISACHNQKNIDVYKDFMSKEIPMVFFDRTIDNLSVPKVKIDDYIKSFFMVEFLIRSGRRQIIHLAGPSFIQNTHERIRAYKDAMEKFNLPVYPEYIINSGVNFEDGEKSMEEFMKKQVPFDAIFCFTEMSALGAKSFLQKLNYSIPKDVSICTVSGTSLSTMVYPRLTVVEQPVKLMAEKSVELIMEKLDNPKALDKEIILEAKMIIREST